MYQCHSVKLHFYHLFTSERCKQAVNYIANYRLITQFFMDKLVTHNKLIKSWIVSDSSIVGTYIIMIELVALLLVINQECTLQI